MRNQKRSDINMGQKSPRQGEPSGMIISTIRVISDSVRYDSDDSLSSYESV